MNAGVTRAGCVLRRVRTLQARIAAPAPRDSLYPAMARTVKVQRDKETMCAGKREKKKKHHQGKNTTAESSVFIFNKKKAIVSQRIL